MYGADAFGAKSFRLKAGAEPYELLGTNELRLSLASATPFPTSSITAATSVKLMTFGRGNRITLYDTTTSDWVPRALTAEVSVAVPSTLFCLFDIWAYWTGSAIALETTNWNQTTGTITAASSAAPVVLTSTAHGLSGDMVGIADIVGSVGANANLGLNGAVWTVANGTANTFEAQGSDGSLLLYTSGGTWYKVPNTRATALVQQDGVYCKTGDLSRRYLGTGMTTGVSGQCETQFGGIGTPGSWLLWNFYNQRQIELRAAENGDSWNYTAATWRPINLRGKLNRCGFVQGLDEHQVQAFALHHGQQTTDGNVIGTGLDLDGLGAADNFLKAAPAGDLAAPDAVLLAFARLQTHTGIGFHYIGQTEYSTAAGTTTWHGDGGQPAVLQTGMTLQLWC